MSTAAQVSPGLPDMSTRVEVSEYLQISASTLAQWAMVGKGPKPIKLGRHVRYRREDVLAWLEAQANAS